MQTTFRKIKCGHSFKFDIDGPVFVKCRGGFRHGLGGQLHACQPRVSVYSFNPMGGIET